MVDPQSFSFAQEPQITYTSPRALPAPYFLNDVNKWLLAQFDDLDAAAIQPQLVRSLDAFMPPDEIAADRRNRRSIIAELNCHQLVRQSVPDIHVL